MTIEAPVDGSEVVLTVDSQLQQLAEAALERGRVRADADRGVVMVVDPRTMEVLALAEAPALSREANREPWRLFPGWRRPRRSSNGAARSVSCAGASPRPSRAPGESSSARGWRNC